MVAVVVPSPASSFALFATSDTSLAPMFMYLSAKEIAFATVTPSLVIFGPPNDCSITTFRPFGPSVEATSSLRRFIPFFDRVLVKRIEAITQTKSGVLLPEKAHAQMSAQVVEVGPGLRDKTGKFLPMTVKIGDKVMIPEFGGTKVEIDDQVAIFVAYLKEHFIFRESDLLGKISI
ncbi:hypothetical protein MXB_1094 [Myxobolus squamalis]|nr:hypothetical protein MXB_1094 [Myxobolus squamalis]